MTESKSPDLSPGHQSEFDKAKNSEEQRKVLQEEIKNDKFAIWLLESAIAKPRFSEEEKQEKRNQIVELQQHIAELEAQIKSIQ